MSGDDAAWRACFSSDDYMSRCHMDCAAVGDFFEMDFTTQQRFNGFRFECGSDGQTTAVNVFDVQ